jgi:hypothetical protein
MQPCIDTAILICKRSPKFFVNHAFESDVSEDAQVTAIEILCAHCSDASLIKKTLEMLTYSESESIRDSASVNLLTIKV